MKNKKGMLQWDYLGWILLILGAAVLIGIALAIATGKLDSIWAYIQYKLSTFGI